METIEQMYTVTWYKSIDDLLDDKLSVYKCSTLQEAESMFHCMLGNHMGAVNIVHPTEAQ